MPPDGRHQASPSSPGLSPPRPLLVQQAGQVRALSRAPRCEVGREPFPPRLASSAH